MLFAEKPEAQGVVPGVLSIPEYTRPSAPAFIVLKDAGDLGAGRRDLIAEWATTLKTRGFICVSLEVSFTTDSADSTASRIKYAMETLEHKFSCSGVVISGLGGAADLALAVALQCEHTTGVILLDGTAFRTHRFYFHRFWDHYCPSSLCRQKWLGRIKQLNDLLSDVAEPGAPADTALILPDSLYKKNHPDELVNAIATLVKRGIYTHFAFTSSASHYYNHHGQLFDILKNCPIGNYVSERFYKTTVGNPLSPEKRQLILDDLMNWAESYFDRQSSDTADQRLDHAA